MHAWALICAVTIAPVKCNLDTAERWFEVAPAARHHVSQSIANLGIFDPNTLYIKIFEYGGSLGTDSYIYYPCDSSPTTIQENLSAEPDQGASLRAELARGSCLR
jgi:hypothetical protein